MKADRVTKHRFMPGIGGNEGRVQERDGNRPHVNSISMSTIYRDTDFEILVEKGFASAIANPRKCPIEREEKKNGGG